MESQRGRKYKSGISYKDTLLLDEYLAIFQHAFH